MKNAKKAAVQLSFQGCLLILPVSLHRLGYAEERLRFALQLHQPLSSDSTSASTTGSSRPTAQESTIGGLAGTGTGLHGSQAAVVLHMEVQRLAADRAMLLHNMQVRYMCCLYRIDVGQAHACGAQKMLRHIFAPCQHVNKCTGSQPASR